MRVLLGCGPMGVQRGGWMMRWTKQHLSYTGFKEISPRLGVPPSWSPSGQSPGQPSLSRALRSTAFHILALGKRQLLIAFVSGR